MPKFTKTAFTILASLALQPALAGTDPPRKTRAESSFGIHFDFHAEISDREIGKSLTPELIESMLKKVKPDFIQIDCKGHAGFSSYPTKVGNPAGGFVRDPLKLFREVTAAHGVALYVHYSGVLDGRAVELHPDWAAKNAAGVASKQETSRHSPYVDELLIPQLKEIADYGVDGAWVDGENWAAKRDYSAASVADFTRQTGFAKAPAAPGEPGWSEWTDFTRGAFKNYLRRYVNTLHAYKPDFQIASNWAYSGFMPEPVDVNVDFLSGDVASNSGLYSAAFESRCLAPQGKPWDLMAWSFTHNFVDSFGSHKNPQAIMQEAAHVVAMGGGFQVYYTQNRDASLRPWQFQGMAEVADFCRERQSLAKGATPIPQVAVLYSNHAFYKHAKVVYDYNPDSIIHETKGVTMSLLDTGHCVQVLQEHHLKGRMKDFPVIVVPGWSELEAGFKSELMAYVESGGNLLVTGPDAVAHFAVEAGLKDMKRCGEASLNLGHRGRFATLRSPSVEAVLPQNAAVLGAFHQAPDFVSPATPAAAMIPRGNGKIALAFASVGSGYLERRTRLGAEFLSDIVRELAAPKVEITASSPVHLHLATKPGETLLHMINASGDHDNSRIYEWAGVPPIHDLPVRFHSAVRPRKIMLQPGGSEIPCQYSDGIAAFTVPKLEIHSIIQILHD